MHPGPRGAAGPRAPAAGAPPRSMAGGRAHAPAPPRPGPRRSAPGPASGSGCSLITSAPSRTTRRATTASSRGSKRISTSSMNRSPCSASSSAKLRAAARRMRASAPASSSVGHGKPSLARQRVGRIEPGAAAIGEAERAGTARTRLRQPIREGKAGDRADLARSSHGAATPPKARAELPPHALALGSRGISSSRRARSASLRSRSGSRPLSSAATASAVPAIPCARALRHHVGKPRMQRQLGHRATVRA